MNMRVLFKQLLILASVVVATGSLIWILRMSLGTHELADWCGLIGTGICLSSLLAYLLSSYWGDAAMRKTGFWSPEYCRRQGLYFSVWLSYGFKAYGHSPIWLALLLGLSIGFTAGEMLLKRVYPEMADGVQYISDRLPTMFPK
jgi:hypothetical protein